MGVLNSDADLKDFNGIRTPSAFGGHLMPNSGIRTPSAFGGHLMPNSRVYAVSLSDFRCWRLEIVNVNQHNPYHFKI